MTDPSNREIGQNAGAVSIFDRTDRALVGLAREINEEHRAAYKAASKTLEHVMRAGELLVRAKKMCPYGKWLSWLRENFEGSERTAQAYMRVYYKRHELDLLPQSTADSDFGWCAKGRFRGEETPSAKEACTRGTAGRSG